MSLLEVERRIKHDNPSISVVVSSIQSRELKGVRYIREQTIDDFELIFVTDNYEEDHRNEARNAGIEAAKAEIIGLTDDDCAPPPGWLETAVRVFRNNPNLRLIEGPIDKHKPVPRHYVGANLAVRREAALRLGGFNQEYSGFRGDTEFGWRVEDQYGKEACSYLESWEMVHIGPLKGVYIKENDQRLRMRYPHRYFDILRSPNSFKGRIFHQSLKYLYDVSPKLAEAIYQSVRLKTKS